jgi:hypothetical protein
MEKDVRLKGLKWIVVFLFAAPSSIYLICICSVAGKSVASVSVTGVLAQWFFIVINAVRILASMTGIAYAVSTHDLGSTDPIVYNTNLVQAPLTLAYSVLSILFTIGVFCPTTSGPSNLWFPYIDWFYFVFLAVLVLYFGLMFENLSPPQQEYRKSRVDKKGDISTSGRRMLTQAVSPTGNMTSPSLLTSPLRTFLERAPEESFDIQQTAASPQLPLQAQNLQVAKKDSETLLSHLLSGLGVFLGLFVTCMFLLDFYFFRDHQQALIQCLLTTSCLSLAGHFFFGAFRSEPPSWGKYGFVTSCLVGIVLITAVPLFVILPSAFSIYTAYALWPFTAIAICCSHHGVQADKTMNLINPVSPRRTHFADPQASTMKQMDITAILWHISHSFSITIALACFLISIVSALYLPIALACIVFSTSVILTATLKVGSGPIQTLAFTSFLILTVLVGVCLSSILPIFVPKGETPLSFLQRYDDITFNLRYASVNRGYYLDYTVIFLATV